jgi:hypothetical protein
MKELAPGIAQHKNLNVFFMRWNNVTSVGGALLAKAIRESESMMILDVSFNALGCSAKTASPIKTTEMGRTFGDLFKYNRMLAHVDMS